MYNLLLLLLLLLTSYSFQPISLEQTNTRAAPSFSKSPRMQVGWWTPTTNHTEVNHRAIRSIAVAIEQDSMNIWPQWPQDDAAELWGWEDWSSPSLPTYTTGSTECSMCLCVLYSPCCVYAISTVMVAVVCCWCYYTFTRIVAAFWSQKVTQVNKKKRLTQAEDELRNESKFSIKCLVLHLQLFKLWHTSIKL